MNLKINTILLDFGNVLSTFDHSIACRKLASFIEGGNPEQLQQQLCTGKLATLRQTGGQNSENFYRFLVTECGLRSDRCQYEKFKMLWGDIFSPPPVEVQNLLQQVRSDVRMSVASNTEELHWLNVIDHSALVQWLALRNGGKIFTSFSLGFEKPDKRFFLAILESLSIDIGDTLFIDDIPTNTDVFKRMGGHVANFDVSRQSPLVLEEILMTYNVLKT